MPVSFIVRFRPTGPWRFGPDGGARDRVEPLCHSDSVFSAVTHAMAQLGTLEDWLSAMPAVRFSSLYPFQRDTLFVPPPRTLWPPPASVKVRYKAARFVPLAAVRSLIGDKTLDEDRWNLDGESECLLPSERNWLAGPFRKSIRSNAAVDRLSPGIVEPHATACLEFAPDAGLWMLVVFADAGARDRWIDPLRGALKFLADTGLGGERSRGWGRSGNPDWEERARLIHHEPPGDGAETAHWLLSLYAPAPDEIVDWTRGSYTTVTRTGRIESRHRWGEVKKATLMIAEGSVLLSTDPPRGVAHDIAPEGFPHPVLRVGYAVSIPLPVSIGPVPDLSQPRGVA